MSCSGIGEKNSVVSLGSTLFHTHSKDCFLLGTLNDVGWLNYYPSFDCSTTDNLKIDLKIYLKIDHGYL